MLRRWLFVSLLTLSILTGGPLSPGSNLQPENTSSEDSHLFRQINGLTVPVDFPEISIEKKGITGSGRLFLGTTHPKTGNYLLILEDDGTPYFYRRYPSAPDAPGCGDFKLHPTGFLSAFLYAPRHFIVLDSHFNEIDTVQAQNGYGTDSHELILLPNGNALLIALELQKMDLSRIVEGGRTDALVFGNHIQELDVDKNVVFEWRCWDHFDIGDAVHEDLTAPVVDYVHMNAIAIDFDGHLLISSRHLSEITKIHRSTGAIIWRFGGKHNEFEILNDDTGFFYQHYVRPVTGKPGHYLLFDNGNYRKPYFSRAVEFKLDTQSGTAEKIWEYRHTPDKFVSQYGSVQRLPAGNTLINWSTWPPLYATEVSQNGESVFQIRSNDFSSERVHRFDWSGKANRPDLIVDAYESGVFLIFNQFGNPDVTLYHIYGDTVPEPNRPLETTSETTLFLSGLQSNRNWYFRVTSVNGSGVESPFSNQVRAFVKRVEAGQNKLLNGDFSRAAAFWSLTVSDQAAATGKVSPDGRYQIDILQAGSSPEQIVLSQDNIELIQGKTYRLELDVSADSTRLMSVKISGAASADYGRIGLVQLGPAEKHLSFDFLMQERTDLKASLRFLMGGKTPGIKIDNVSLVSVDESGIDEPSEQPRHFGLSQNYPNPFNPVTSICYQLAESGHVTLSIYDLSGRLVETLVDKNQVAGQYRVFFYAADYASGIYLYRLKSPSSIATQKMTLLR